MKVIISNAFSLNMLTPRDGVRRFSFTPMPVENAANVVKRAERLVWAIGHADTSRVVAKELGIGDPGPNRITLCVSHGENKLGNGYDGAAMLVAQYSGPRLPEGATDLPEGAQIVYWLVTGEK